MLIAQSLLLQVHQLAKRHSQNGVRLDRGQVVDIGFAAFILENGKAIFAKRFFHHRRWAVDAHQSNFSFGLSFRSADNGDDFVDVGQRHQQAFDGVLLLTSTRQQKFCPAANHLHAVPQKLSQEIFQ